MFAGVIQVFHSMRINQECSVSVALHDNDAPTIVIKYCHFLLPRKSGCNEEPQSSWWCCSGNLSRGSFGWPCLRIIALHLRLPKENLGL